MLKYLKHYIPAFTGVLFIVFVLLGENFPTFFAIAWSLFLIVGDYVLPRDREIQKFSYPTILNVSIYINLPILFCLIFLVVSVFGNNSPDWYVDGLHCLMDFLAVVIPLPSLINFPFYSKPHYSWVFWYCSWP